MYVTEEKPAGKGSDMAGEKILVVDDDLRTRESLIYTLEAYRTRGAASAREALECLKKANDIELVILDVKLPDMSGTDLLTEIKRINPSLRVIMLTGFGSKDVMLKALRGRADDYLEKPFNVNEMKNTVERMLDSRPEDKLAQSNISMVKRFLDKNFNKHISLNDMAAVAHLSPKYLSRAFKNQTGENITAYRVRCKVSAAKQLLKSTSYNVNQIANLVGYENAESFVKAFKRATGSTPSGYRKSMNAK